LDELLTAESGVVSWWFRKQQVRKEECDRRYNSLSMSAF
jgi:hypothetical protein